MKAQKDLHRSLWAGLGFWAWTQEHGGGAGLETQMANLNLTPSNGVPVVDFVGIDGQSYITALSDNLHHADRSPFLFYLRNRAAGVAAIDAVSSSNSPIQYDKC